MSRQKSWWGSSSTPPEPPLVVRLPELPSPGEEASEPVPSQLLDSMDPEQIESELRDMIEHGPTDADLLRVHRLLGHSRPRIRCLALEVLEASGTVATPAIRGSLADPIDEVRAAAIRVAGTDLLGLPDVIPFAGARDWPKAQAAALDVLPSLIRRNVEFSDADVSSVLLSIARAPSPPLERELAPFAELAKVVGIESVLRALDASDRRRIGAARLLIAERSPKALRALAEHREDEDQEIRALGQVAAERAGDQPAPEDASVVTPDGTAIAVVDAELHEELESETDRIRSLASSLLDPDESVREDALRTISEPGWSSVLAWVRETLYAGSDEDARLAANLADKLMLSAMAAPILRRATDLRSVDRGVFVRALMSFELDPTDLMGLPAELDAKARAAAMPLLWEIGGRAILPLLSARLEELSREERIAALHVFEEANDPEVYELGQRLLSGDPSAAVRAAAVRSLAHGSPARRLASLEMALGDPSAEVRALAVDVLPSALGSQAASLVLSALSDADGRVAGAAVRHLNRLADTDPTSVWVGLKRAKGAARRALLDALDREHSMVLRRLRLEHLDAPDPEDRVLAIELGTGTEDEASIRTFERALEDPNPMVRLAATRSMSGAASPAVASVLARALSDPSPDVRIQAVLALARQDERAALERLVPMLGDPHPGVAAASREALGSMRSWALARRLIRAISTPEHRSGARALLLGMGSFVVDLLIDGLSGPDATTRGILGELLLEIEGLDEFSRRLTSTDRDRRSAAVEAIAAIGGADAVDLLARVLTDPEEELRIRALRRLGELGDARVSAAVEACAEMDPVREVAEEARRTLARLQASAGLTDLPPVGG